MQNPERRRYFRINDVVGLNYQPIAASESQQTGAREAQNVHISTIDLWRSVDRELTAALDGLWQNNPAAANALGLLNKKIDILANEMSLDYSSVESIAAKSQRVNISACGIAFEGPDSFDVGQTLALTIVLKPANTPIKVTGRVIECEKMAESGGFHYLLRINFNPVPAHLQEQLIQHIVRRQSSQLGQQLREQEP